MVEHGAPSTVPIMLALKVNGRCYMDMVHTSALCAARCRGKQEARLVRRRQTPCATARGLHSVRPSAKHVCILAGASVSGPNPRPRKPSRRSPPYLIAPSAASPIRAHATWTWSIALARYNATAAAPSTTRASADSQTRSTCTRSGLTSMSPPLLSLGTAADCWRASAAAGAKLSTRQEEQAPALPMTATTSQVCARRRRPPMTTTISKLRPLSRTASIESRLPRCQLELQSGALLSVLE